MTVAELIKELQEFKALDTKVVTVGNDLERYDDVVGVSWFYADHKYVVEIRHRP
jgi:hypothetical protein